MRLLVAALVIVLAGCARHLAPPPPPVSSGPSYVELEAGWHVRVITPMLKSGGFPLKIADRQEAGNMIALRAGDDFLGYETAAYAVEARKDGGVRVALTGVDLNRDGAITHPAKSVAPRLRMPTRFRRVRLLYMRKVSNADHAMAVLAAPDSQRLAALTHRVQTSPATCRNNRNEYCEWIPAGVAVRPEYFKGSDWIPAR